MSKYTIQNKAQSTPSAKQWKPWPYQKKAMKFLLEHACAGLLLDPGLGKTSISLGAITELKRADMFEKALVIAPRRVIHDVWPTEAEEWKQFRGLRVAVMHGSEKKREAALESDADIYCINPEGLPWLFSTGSGKVRIDRLKPCTLIVDESSKFKHTNTQRFKLLKPYLNKFKRRWILTGTPMPNGYEDLFGQMYILDLGASLGAYVSHYRITYFFPTGYGGYTWKLKPGADKLIQARIKPYTLRFEAEDYVKMPELMPSTRRVDLPDKARELYDEMEEEMFVTLDGNKEVEALSAGAAMNKCSQIANGGLYYMSQQPITNEASLLALGKREQAVIHDAKTKDLEDLIEELSGVPCAIAYEFQHDLERLRTAFGKDLPVIGGGTSDARGSELIKMWNNKELPILACHPAAMSHGLNLQKGGNHVAFYSIPWDYELYDQLIRRFRRQGAEYDVVFVHHIVARDTVDEAKMRALSSKAREQGAFMNALKQYRANRQKIKA